MELTEQEIENLRQIFQEKTKEIEKAEKDPNTLWGMYYFGFDYEQESKTLYFRTIEDASKFSQLVDPSLRSLGWFPIKLNGSDIELELSKTELFLSKLYIELESRSKENFQVQI
ncbi:hypothetical protein [Lactococcus lactis]|uniref:hypothetical protein n=1 Tax=Lactococcus lactis TaxID=1358 RepID=UPI0019117EFC|nr:hypothetical protein [Lactococcus lactis]WDA67558.1 hypothetical protein IL310_01870 [Lactococcus lactis]